MKRRHRSVHWFMWVLLAPVLAYGVYAGIQARQAMPQQDPIIDARELDATPGGQSQ
jgi:hypothetical protein